MSDGQLHQISEAIGSLKQSALDSARAQSVIFEKLEEINQKLVVVPEIQDDIKDLKPKVEKLQRGQHVRTGVIGTLTFLAGAFGSSIIELLKR